jgi:hypothetical protein
LRREVSSLAASRTNGWAVVFCKGTARLDFVDHGVGLDAEGTALAAVSPVGSGFAAVCERLSSRISSDVLFLLVITRDTCELFDPIPETQDILSRGALQIIFGHA